MYYVTFKYYQEESWAKDNHVLQLEKIKAQLRAFKIYTYDYSRRKIFCKRSLCSHFPVGYL